MAVILFKEPDVNKSMIIQEPLESLIRAFPLETLNADNTVIEQLLSDFRSSLGYITLFRLMCLSLLSNFFSIDLE